MPSFFKKTFIAAIAFLFIAYEANSILINDNHKQLEFLAHVLKKVEDSYVEEVDETQLIQSALRGMLTSLDPYSDFLDEEAFHEMQITTKGEFGGIGIKVMVDKGILKIISPYEGSPAFKAGIKAGDYITKINDTPITKMRPIKAIEELRGTPGTTVKLSVHKVDGRNADYSIARETIRIEPVRSQLMDNGQIAYIKLGDFSNKVADILKHKYNDMHKQAGAKLKGIILDLRWNPGGLLKQATEVASLFLDQGTIVSIKGRNKSTDQDYKAREHDIAKGLPIVVLINKGSASASEIVAGALQDNKRALIVGTESFGKGSVQSIVPLSKGTAIKLTTALYYTPSGVSIHNKGITPDIEVEEAFIQRIDNTISLDKSNISAKQKSNNLYSEIGNVTDFQLLRAIDIVKSIILLQR